MQKAQWLLIDAAPPGGQISAAPRPSTGCGPRAEFRRIPKLFLVWEGGMTMTESTEVKSSDAGNLQLETWPIARLVPSPRNARKHSKA